MNGCIELLSPWAAGWASGGEGGSPFPRASPPHRPATRVLPPNFRDVTAEKVGTVVAIVGATAAGKGTEPG